MALLLQWGLSEPVQTDQTLVHRKDSHCRANDDLCALTVLSFRRQCKRLTVGKLKNYIFPVTELSTTETCEEADSFQNLDFPHRNHSGELNY